MVSLTNEKLQAGSSERGLAKIEAIRARARAAEMLRHLMHKEATDWLDRGVPVVLVREYGKAPVGDDWPSIRYTQDDLNAKLLNTTKIHNIGILLGPESGIIDIECDNPEAVRDYEALTDGVDPVSLITPMFMSGKGPHRLFRFPKRLAELKTATVNYGALEIRLGIVAAQSLVPPSQTDSGARAWMAGLSPEEVPFAELPEIVVDRILQKANTRVASPKTKPSLPVDHVTIGGEKKPGYKGLLIDPFLEKYKVPVKSEKPGPGPVKRILIIDCPWCDEHTTKTSPDERLTDDSASFMVMDSGVVIFECKHAHCGHRTVHDAVEKIGKVLPEHVDSTKIFPDPVVSNSITIPIGESEITKPLTFDEIVTKMRKTFGDWPARVSNHLFIDTGNQIESLDTPAKLFGWMRGGNRIVKWDGGGDKYSKSEFHAELSRTAKRYVAVEDWPHEPPLPEHYYVNRELPDPTGKTIEAFLDFFTPETQYDRQLILAAIMTLFWGSADGSKPCFAITSEQGRGVGKTTFVNIIARLVGGLIDVTKNGDSEKIKERLLTPGETTKRVVLLDNVKSLGLSWPELEALITSSVISGRQLYVGGASRPNNVVWFLTLNNAQLSRDMAQRAVIINLAKHTNDKQWHPHVCEFIGKNHLALIADIIAKLKQPGAELQRFTRWARWEAAVLAKLPDPDLLQQLIACRQGDTDTDNRTMDIIEDGFRDRLSFLGYDTENDKIHIPTVLTIEWFREIESDRNTTSKLSSALKQLTQENPEWCIQSNPSHKNGRGFIWNPGIESGNIRYDIRERIMTKGKDKWLKF